MHEIWGGGSREKFAEDGPDWDLDWLASLLPTCIQRIQSSRLFRNEEYLDGWLLVERDQILNQIVLQFVGGEELVREQPVDAVDDDNGH